MPPDYGMPYGAAPAFCFPLTEISVYLLLIVCVWHSLKHNAKYLGFMLGGIVFGLLLEFVDVYFLKGYTYGRFMIMLGNNRMISPCGLVSDGGSSCIPPDYLLIKWDFQYLQPPHSMPSWHSISTQRWMSLLVVCTCGIGVGRYRITIR